MPLRGDKKWSFFFYLFLYILFYINTYRSCYSKGHQICILTWTDEHDVLMYELKVTVHINTKITLHILMRDIFVRCDRYFFWGFEYSITIDINMNAYIRGSKQRIDFVQIDRWHYFSPSAFIHWPATHLHSRFINFK